MDFLSYLAGLSGSGIIGITGGNTFLIIALFLLGMAWLFIQAEVSMPYAVLMSIFSIGVLVSILDNPGDTVLQAGKGFGFTIWAILLAASGLLIWHLFFRRSQAGTG